MLVNNKSIYYFNLLTDIIIVLISLFFAYYFCYNVFLRMEEIHFIFLFIFFVLWYISAKPNRFYEEYRSKSFAAQYIALLKTNFNFTLGLIFFIFLYKHPHSDRKIVFYYLFISLFLLSVKYYGEHVFFNYIRKKGKNVRKVLLVGGGKLGEAFYNIIVRNPNFGYHLVGIVGNKEVFNKELFLGSIDKIEEIIEQNFIDDIVITGSSFSDEELKKIIILGHKFGKRVRVLPNYYEFFAGNMELSIFGNLPIITFRKEPLDEVSWRFVKRIFDIIFSLFVIVFILSWFTPLIALINKFTGAPGPVFFKQDRIGKNGKIFKAYKFRSMYVNVSKNRADFKAVTENDHRITPLGKFLRKSNLDELPQFINVFKGEMSIVGPRPHAIAWHEKYAEYVEEIQLRHRVKPGITGWAQIHGYRGDVEDEELNRIRTKKRIELDLWYIENWSFLLDIQIIGLTVWQMLRGKTNAV